MQMTYVRLLVDQFDACYAFYSDVIGLTPTWGKPGETYASFRVSESVSLSLYKRELMLQALGLPDAPVTKDHYGFALILEADDLEAEFERLQVLGVGMLSRPTERPGWGIRCFHLADPEGNLIEVNTELPKKKWADDLKTHPDAEKYPEK